MLYDILRLELILFSNWSLNCDFVDEYVDVWLFVDCRIRLFVLIWIKLDGLCFV